MKEAINTVSLEKAQTWVAAWGEKSNIDIKAFLIPEIDITQVLNEDGVENVRAYLGIDENGTPKMMVVGVDKNGQDMINDDQGFYIYDFTRPCPQTCDFTSPLMK